MNLAGLQECLASAVRYIQDHAGIDAAPYFDEIPENFIVPSIYFPVPRTETRKATLSSWKTDIQMECWFAAATGWQAFGYAETVRDCILRDNCAMDIINADGTANGQRVRVSEPSIRKQEDRIVCMSFTVKNYLAFEETVPTIDDYHYSIVPVGSLYDAWRAATAGLREQEEEQREWLERITGLTNP